MREPVSGYASKKDAIMAMLAEGLSDDEIVFRAKTTAGSVAAYRSQRNARGTMSREKAAKAHRIVEKAIQVMADGIGCSPAQLHQFIKRNYFGFDRAVPEPALPPEQKVDEAEPARAGLVDTPSTIISDTSTEVAKDVVSPNPASNDDDKRDVPAFLPKREPPVIVAKPKNTTTYDELTGASQVTLRATNDEWLNMNGSGTTRVKAYRYLGTPAQAKKMRLASKFATGMRIESASPNRSK